MPRPELLGVRQGPAQTEDATEVAIATEPEVMHVQIQSDRIRWARLLKRVFDIDMQHCPNCDADEGSNRRMDIALPEALRALALRVELQSAVIQEMARCLSRQDAARCADALLVQSQLLLARYSPLPEAVDAAVTGELAGLLGALGQPPEI